MLEAVNWQLTASRRPRHLSSRFEGQTFTGSQQLVSSIDVLSHGRETMKSMILTADICFLFSTAKSVVNDIVVKQAQRASRGVRPRWQAGIDPFFQCPVPLFIPNPPGASLYAHGCMLKP